MSAEPRISDREAVLLLVACDFCGTGSPIANRRSIRGPRLRCAACQIAVIEAMESLVVRRAAGPRVNGDETDRAVTCFECKTPADDEQAGSTRLFVCSHCGSHCFTR